MTDTVTDTGNAETVDTSEDLDAFEKSFFGGTPEKIEEVAETVEPEETVIDEVDPPAPAEVNPEDEETEDVETESKFHLKKKQSARERIEELNRKLRETERQAEADRIAYEARLNALDTKKEVPVKAKEPTEGPDPDELVDGEAKYPLGEFDPLYIRDLTRFTYRQEKQQDEAKENAAREEAEMATARNALVNSWEGKVSEAEKALPDIRQKGAALEDAFSNLDPGYGEYLAGTIMSMEHGPEVLYYLSDNVALAKDIASKGPVAATIALGRLEAQFTRVKETTPPKVTKAPEPPATRTRGSSGRFDTPDDTDDLDAFSSKFYG